MPQIQHNAPPYLQIADHYRNRIVTGELTAGAALPPVRAIAAEWDVATATVQRALRHLKVAGLITTTSHGTFVNGSIVRPSPGDRLAAVKAGGAYLLRTEHMTVTDAGLVPAAGAWDYVADLLGVEPGGDVIRRQWVCYDEDGTPSMLAVSWFHPSLAGPVPELLDAEPVPGEGGEAALITARTGRAVTYSEESARARGILDDGREPVIMGLPAGSPCYAGVYLWFDSTGPVVYTEFVLPPDRVVSHRHAWA